MASPVERKKKANNIQELDTTSTPASNSEVTAPTFRANFYAPAVFKANITTAANEDKLQTMPLYSLVGEDGLAPYVWISLAGDSARDRQVNFTPSRRGLKAVTLKNEYNKYPNVELEMYVPEYRESSTESNSPTLGESSRALKDFRVGNTFSINWGYTRAHTRWGLFTIYERKIEFAQGTALLIVRGKMGAKLTATTSAEVFSSTTEKPVGQKVAQAAGQSANFDEMTPAEFANLVRRKQVVTGGNTIGQSLHKLASNAGLELVVDPTNDTLMFSTPFKLDLVKKGTPITRMTYGFPTSMIAEIDVETKRPKRSGTGKRKPTPVNISMGYEPKTRTGTSLIYGTLLLPSATEEEDFNYLNVGFTTGSSTELPNASEMRGKSLFGRKSDTPQKALEAAEGVFPKKDGYRIKINEPLNRTLPPGSEGGYYVLVYKKTEITTNTVEEFNSQQQFNELGDATFKSQLEIQKLSERARQESDFYFEVQNSPPPTIKDGVLKYPVRTLKAIKGRRPNQERPNRTESTTSTIQSAGDDEMPEGMENLETVSVSTELLNQYDKVTRTRQEKAAFLKNLDREGKPELREFLRQRDRFRANKSDTKLKLRGRTVSSGGTTTLTFGRLLVRDPEESKEVPVDLSFMNPATASHDGEVRPETRPASISTGTPRPSRSLSGLKVTLRLKAGDWTMRVGKIVELTNVYKTVDGFYYIHSEEHQIDDNGFHTTLTCKRATHRQVSDAKQGKVTSLKKGTRKDGNSTQEATDSKRPQSFKPAPAIKQAKDKKVIANRNAEDVENIDINIF